MAARWKLIALTLPLAFAAACRTHPIADTVVGPVHKPANVYRAGPTLPADLRRVAVLPLVGTGGESVAAGARQLQALVHLEFNKSGAVELVPVAPEQLAEWTGRGQWQADDALPSGFLERLRERLGCEGVLFAALTHYRPYPPVAVGWKFKLVDTRSIKAVWAADEVFDASEPAVANAARRYFQGHVTASPVLNDSHSILGSPGRFAQYSLAALVATLPGR